MLERAEIIGNLKRKAEGYTVEETVIEYAIDDSGVRTPVKERTQTKIIPPDVTALKMYLDLIKEEDDLSRLSDDELIAELKRVVAELGAL